MNDAPETGRFHETEEIPRIDPAELELPPIPDFEVLELLARGAHTLVFKARHQRHGRPIALKVLTASQAQPRRLAQFLREASLVTMLQHEHIVAGYDFGEVDGTHYLALELVDGHSLETLLDRGGALDERRATRIVTQLAQAVAYLAEEQIVHRDIKPGNVVLHRRGVAKLCDLGFARRMDESDEEEEGFTLGTPNYISPEQARGASDIDVRSDLYSLGATYYHMVTGEPPFTGSNPADLMARHISEIPIPPRERGEVRDEVSWVIERLLAKDPDERYPGAGALIRDLEAIQDGTFVFPARRASESSLRLLKAKPGIPLAQPEPPDDAPPPRFRRRRR
jgi:serine/threonine-protein kinase